MKKILFANIGWMIHYKGYSSADVIKGGGSHPAKLKYETFLFQKLDDMCYGYVHPTKGSSLNLEKIDPSAAGNDKVTGVLVVWTACRPDEGGNVIVGWFKNATVYRKRQPGKKVGRIHRYNITAKSKDCVLLPTDARIVGIPRMKKGGMGRSNVWYASDPKIHTTIRKEVEAYVSSYKSIQLIYKSVKKKAETMEGVDIVTRRYQELGYEVKSVQKTEFGWNVNVEHNKISLHINVKVGGSGIQSFGIADDEYGLMASESRMNYRVCVVAEDVRLSQEISTFLFDGRSWVCDEDLKKLMTVNRKEITITQI